MKQHFIALFIIVLHSIFINGMQEKNLTIKQYKISIKETKKIIIAIKKNKKNGKELIFLHSTNNLTREQSWIGYKKNYFNSYVTYYKFDPETARRKWKQFNNHYNQNALVLK